MAYGIGVYSRERSRHGLEHEQEAKRTLSVGMQDESISLEEEGIDSGVTRRGPKHVQLPAESSVLREARLLAGDRNVRIGKLTATVAQDPVITLELLRTANAAFFSGERPSITTVQNAVIRLGSETIVQTLDTIGSRGSFEDPDVYREFEALRALSRKTSVVGSIIADKIKRDVSEMVQTAGLMTYMNYMIACAYLQEDYIDVSLGRKRTSLAYRIQQDFGFDINKTMLEYLRANGIPTELFYGLDRELKCKTTSQSSLRFIVESAVELVEAWSAGRWEKYSPNQTLPSKSSLRLLTITDAQYADIYEDVQAALKGSAKKKVEDEPAEEKESVEAKSKSKLSALAPSSQKSSKTRIHQRRSESMRVAPTLILTKRGFGGYDPNAQPTNFIESEDTELEEEKAKLSDDAKQVLDLISTLCLESKTANELLVRLMSLLISDGPFVRAALITLTNNRESADIHTAIGDGFENGDTIAVSDPLSPLALCLTQIKSFNSKHMNDSISPFGITSYAISPIRITSEVPVVLYADCGVDRPLALEARKIFRLVVGLINRTLPRLSGGLPNRAVLNAK